MTNYADKVARTATKTPQNMKARDDQVVNNAGGYVFEVDKWARLERFIILGSEKNTYYMNAVTLLNENYESLIQCVKEDGLRAVNTIVEISDAGRAPKNAPAVFAMAVCAAFGDKITKETAFRNMPAVARTATDFFNFIDAYKTLGGGFGVVARKGIENWYMGKEISSVAYQMIKYRQRDGWTHLDALRLSHAKPRNDAENNLFAFAKTLAGKTAEYDVELLPTVAQGYLKAKDATKVSEVVNLITDYNLPREAIPTQFLNEADVWAALLPKMPATALIRNLGKMTSVGIIGQLKADGNAIVLDKLSNDEWLKKSRIHPITVLNAMAVYKLGHGVRGSLTWSPSSKIVDALDGAFYKSFNHVEPTGKSTMLALDISGSMGWSSRNEVMTLTPREITAAMSMATARVEEDYVFTAFTTTMRELDISPRQRLDDVVAAISRLPMGGTDCAMPMVYALQHKMHIDTFVIYTDNETWAGGVHPFEALKKYRKEMNPNAKLVVCATDPTSFSIADPNDAGMLDICGFDTNVPNIISDFAKK